jgi:hypothetical protein
MKFKQKVLSASVLACFMATPAFANGINSLNDLIDDAIDLDDAMVRVVSAAINLNSIDASVSITGSQISITSSDSIAKASADSIGVVGTDLSAIANAISGNIISTTAIGAVNDTTLGLLNDVTYSSTLTMTADFTTSGEDGVYFGGFIVQNNDNDVQAAQSGGVAGVINNNLNTNSFDGGEFDYGNYKNGTAVFQSAYNAADINASVSIAAAPAYVLDSFWDRNRALPDHTVAINNININTTAIGAINNGAIEVGNTLAESYSTTLSVVSSIMD